MAGEFKATGAVLDGVVDMSGASSFRAPAPKEDDEVSTKAYSDALAAGFQYKDSVQAATAAPLPAYTRVDNTITADAPGALPLVDGIDLAGEDRVLLLHGAAPRDNGLYVVTDQGSDTTPFVLTRAPDADTSEKVTSGQTAFVNAGAKHADQSWSLVTDGPITLNETDLAYAQTGGKALYRPGAGITIAENVVAADFGTAGKQVLDAGRVRNGREDFADEDTRPVAFADPYPDEKYSVLLTPSDNRTAWVTDKAPEGFTIHVSALLRGVVEWLAVKDD